MSKTPLIDQWRKRTEEALTGYGKKAALARWLADRYGGEPRAWQVTIQAMLRRQIPNGELVLAVNEWLSKQK